MTDFTDEESQDVLKKIDTSHKQPLRLKKILYEYGEDTQNIIRDRLVLSDDTPGYQTILDGMHSPHDRFDSNID